MSKLKPCPFCGCKQVSIREINIQGMFQAQCWGCDVATQPTFVKSTIVEEWNRRASGWISVEDRLPEENCLVLGYPETHRTDGACGVERVVKFDGEFWSTKHGQPGCVSITHWMPLPDPPEAP